MKNSLKKIMAILLACVMVFAMTATVFAEEEPTETGTGYSLTVNSQYVYDRALTYNVYQLLKCDLDSNNVPSYTKEGAKNADLLGTDATVESISAMAANSEALYKLASEAVESSQLSDANRYNELTTGTKLENVEAGYYLLVPTNLADTSDIDEDTFENEGGTVSAPILVAVPTVTQAEDGTYSVTEEVVVIAKSSTVFHKKKITGVESVNGTDNTFSTSGDTAVAGEGDTITYTITNTIPRYKENVDKSKVNYYVVDKYDANLELINKNAITVTLPTNLKEGTLKTTTVNKVGEGQYYAYTVDGGDYCVVRDDANRTFTVYFDYDVIEHAEKVEITAKFKQLATAVPGTSIINDSELHYTNNYYKGSDSTLEDEVKSYTFDFDVFKYNTETKEALSGATFGLYKDITCAEENKITTATSNEYGLVDFAIELNEGTYYVKETAAPAGFRVDENVYVVEIKAKKVNNEDAGEYTGEYTVTVDGNEISTSVTVGEDVIYDGDNTNTIPVFGVGNTPGITLPGTGGIGTTIFTIGGIVLVLLAAAMFIVYMRRQKEEQA